jgi:hypothetical protein
MGMIYALSFLIGGLAGWIRGGAISGWTSLSDDQVPDKGIATLIVGCLLLYVTGMDWSTTLWHTAGWLLFFSMGAWEMSIDLLYGRNPREHEAHGRDLAWDVEEKIFDSYDRKAGFFGLTVNGLIRTVPLVFLTQSLWMLIPGALMGVCYLPGIWLGKRTHGEFLISAIVTLAIVAHI